MCKILDVTLSAGETIIDVWDVYYTLNDNLMFFGALLVTTKRLFFEPKAENAAHDIIRSSSAITLHKPGIIEISKESIVRSEPQKNNFSNKVALHLNNNEMHIFDRCMLPVEKIVSAINLV